MSTTTQSITAPAVGQPWPEQGGIYVGSRLVDGRVHHIIIPGGTDFDVPASHDNAAERIAAKGEINGFSDWRQGDQRDVLLAYINVPHLFPREGRESIQITATPYGSHHAWAVDFEYGKCSISTRTNEFLARPFRSIIASSL